MCVTTVASWVPLSSCQSWLALSSLLLLCYSGTRGKHPATLGIDADPGKLWHVTGPFVWWHATQLLLLQELMLGVEVPHPYFAPFQECSWEIILPKEKALPSPIPHALGISVIPIPPHTPPPPWLGQVFKSSLWDNPIYGAGEHKGVSDTKNTTFNTSPCPCVPRRSTPNPWQGLDPLTSFPRWLSVSSGVLLSLLRSFALSGFPEAKVPPM